MGRNAAGAAGRVAAVAALGRQPHAGLRLPHVRGLWAGSQHPLQRRLRRDHGRQTPGRTGQAIPGNLARDPRRPAAARAARHGRRSLLHGEHAAAPDQEWLRGGHLVHLLLVARAGREREHCRHLLCLHRDHADGAGRAAPARPRGMAAVAVRPGARLCRGGARAGPRLRDGQRGVLLDHRQPRARGQDAGRGAAGGARARLHRLARWRVQERRAFRGALLPHQDEQRPQRPALRGLCGLHVPAVARRGRQGAGHLHPGPRRHRAAPRAAGAARSRPAEGRIPRHARARAAQPARAPAQRGAHPVHAGGERRNPGARDGSHRPPGRPTCRTCWTT